MEAIEIVIYIAVAIFAGAIMITALLEINHEEQLHDSTVVFKGNAQKYKINTSDLAQELIKRWKSCRFGMDNANMSLYIQDNQSIDRGYLVRELLRLDYCDIVDCRNKTNSFFVKGTITTPKIINIECFNNTLIVS